MKIISPYISLNILFFIIGLIVLIKGSDWFIDAASYIARKFHVSEIVIGLTLVSIGTSLPELATNIYASIEGEGDFAVGNVVGSNIANVALVLGIGAVLMRKIPSSGTIQKRDGTTMIIVYLIFFIFCFFNNSEKGEFIINRYESIIFLIIFSVYMYILFFSSDNNKNEIEDEVHKHESKFSNIVSASLVFIIGLLAVYLGSNLMVDNAVCSAEKLGISKAVIAATIVAFGTSVPELAVTIAGVVKKEEAIALGNIIGSCIFNITLVIGVSACINPISASSQSVYVLTPFMIFTGILLLIFMISDSIISRKEGFALLLIYLIFMTYNILSTVKPALQF